MSELNGPLRPRLQQVVNELEQAMDEVCAEAPASELNTGELIRVEETLAIAADAAKQAVSLRRRLGQNTMDDGPSDSAGGVIT